MIYLLQYIPTQYLSLNNQNVPSMLLILFTTLIGSWLSLMCCLIKITELIHSQHYIKCIGFLAFIWPYHGVNFNQWGRSPGLVFMGDDSCLKGRGFESWRSILDGLLNMILY